MNFEFSYVKNISYNVAEKCLHLIYLTTRMLPEIPREILIQISLAILSFIDYKYAKKAFLQNQNRVFTWVATRQRF